MRVRRWWFGLGAVAVLVATGAWVVWPAGVDGYLWSEVRPVIEARLVADAKGSGYGETEPALRARWFCGAKARDLDEKDGVVRAGVTTLCVEYGVRNGALVECSGVDVPQVVRLKRDADGAYRVVSREEAPDGEGYGKWVEDHFSFFAEPGPADSVSSAGLEAAARDHFGLPADAPVGDC
ncbi:hypothetical protein [Streptomyces colonosanans]|uniref:Uncharacterized protein n=1 Tax=Streptomyces colonosanans TaxID=1428652 RepID=A0A1S2NUK9_9ACTN|nr:hypothetical protein [Streptomyces colonosanans]OIJ84905.1 hypothetical protein BIV24_29850 [Streptomyces colonosanans]